MVARHIKRYDLIDSAWGMTFVVILTAWSLFFRAYHPANNLFHGLIATMVLMWAVRLSWHIFLRFLRSSKEDKRYIDLRSTWKSRSDGAVFRKIYMTQALLATVVSIPILYILLTITGRATPIKITSIIIVGVAVWAIGLMWEVVADHQLRQFLLNKNNRGRTMQSGLWAYSRHPNYFGEIALWWGIGLVALGVSGSLLSLVGPAVLTYLIIGVSGIPPAEKRTSNRQGWTDYKQRTSILFPWPPKTIDCKNKP